MRIIVAVVVLAAIGYFFLDDTSSTAKPDLRHVLHRSASALVNFDNYLKKNNIEKATDQHMAQLTTYMQKAMNLNPRFYPEALIAMKLKKDAKFEGYKDDNKNGKVDEKEKLIFTVEVDSANKRLIATDYSGQSVGRGLTGVATGLLAGALIGNLLGRQQSAGIKPGSFNNRKVTSSSSYARARSRARSGGRFGGK